MFDRRFLLVFTLVFPACAGSGAAGHEPIGDASIDDGLPEDADVPADRNAGPQEDSPTCAGPISNRAPDTHEVAVALDPPLPTGGHVRDGVYFLTNWNAFTGSGGQSGTQSRTMKFTLQVIGNTWQFAISANGGTLDYGTQSVDYSGTSFTANLYCPPPAEAKGATTYSATANELRLYDPTLDSAGVSELVLKKQ